MLFHHFITAAMYVFVVMCLSVKPLGRDLWNYDDTLQLSERIAQ